MFKLFFASEFRQDVMKVLSANVIAQLIALLVYPLVTRMYSPSEFGAFNVLLSICSVFFVLSTGRYESAIVQPKSTRDATAAFQLCMTILLLLSSLLALVVVFFKSQILSLFSMEVIANGIYLLPLLVLFNGVGTIWSRWYNRLKNYAAIANYQVVQITTNSLMKILFGLTGHTSLGLVWSTFLGYAVSFFSFFLPKKNRKYRKLLMAYDKKRIKKVAVEYAVYPTYSLPHAFMNQLSGNLPMLLLTPYFGEAISGIYALSISVGFRPINLISTSMNQVLFQRVVDLYNSRLPILHLLKKLVRKGVLLFLPLFVLLYFLLPQVVTFVFGADWKETAFYMQLQLPWFFTILFTATFDFVPVLFFKQKTAFMIECIYGVSRFLALFWGIFMQDFTIAILAFTWVSVFFVTLRFVWYYLLLLKYEKEISL